MVNLHDYLQCRGQGLTVVDALRAARQEFNHLLDCRLSCMVEAGLNEGARAATWSGRRGAAGSVGACPARHRYFRRTGTFHTWRLLSSA
jgi:hypothetical protein